MSLSRPKQPMPEFVREALEKHNLVEAYDARPPYQRNDYLRWIDGAKREETKQKRLGVMLTELEKGGKYMGMAWHPHRK